MTIFLSIFQSIIKLMFPLWTAKGNRKANGKVSAPEQMLQMKEGKLFVFLIENRAESALRKNSALEKMRE